MTIVRATWRDAGVLRRLMRDCFGPEAYGWVSIVLILIWPGAQAFKALAADGRAVGLVLAGRAWGQGYGWIITLGVHPDFRRQGIAARLLATAEAHLGQPRVRLTVRAGNGGARALYRRAGYVEVERVARYYADGEDGLEMVKWPNTHS